MKTNTTLTWLILVVLTVASALVSKLDNVYVSQIILGLAALKFLGIAFQFMELKKANTLWKGLVVGFLVVFMIAILIKI